jgi:Holliday junction resolvase RusA-like endonuclease
MTRPARKYPRNPAPKVNRTRVRVINYHIHTRHRLEIHQYREISPEKYKKEKQHNAVRIKLKIDIHFIPI